MPMDRWVNRLLDEDENELRSRTCLIADYVRCLRVLGFSHPALESVWRQLSLTLDPLASPDQAVAQLRRFVDAAEANLGEIPESFPRVDFVQSLNQEEVRTARSMWGDRMLRAVFDLGTRRSVFTEADRDEPQSEPPSGLDTFSERPVTSVSENEVASGIGGHDQEQGQAVEAAGGSQVTAEGSGAEVVVRKVQVKTASSDLGQCLVKVSQVDDGNAVFSQVVDYLKRFCEKPPCPQAIFIGDSPDTGEYIDRKDVFVHLFDEAEVPTIWCVDEPVGQEVDTMLTGVGRTPATGGEIVIEMGTVSNEVSVVVHRLAQEIGRDVIKFGSPDIGGWNLVAQDIFQVATGQVVVAQVTQVDGDPELVRHKSLRPRTPSRSPRRRSNVDRSKRQVFGARPPLPVSRPGQQRTYYAGRNNQQHDVVDGGHNCLDEVAPHVRGGGEYDAKVETVDARDVREVSPTLRFLVQESDCVLQEGIGDPTLQVPVLRDPGLVDSNAEFLRVAKHT